MNLRIAATFCWLISLGVNNVVSAQTVETLQVEDADAGTSTEMKRYDERIEHTAATIRMLPIPGGEFLMGSPKSQANRRDDEGPVRKVKIDPFWMAETETTWDAFEVWVRDLDLEGQNDGRYKKNSRDISALEYQLSQPSPPYLHMDFGMGKSGYPAISMTQLAARTFCQWLSRKTGRYYRLPTEAEWEYACRAGTETAYSWGDDPQRIDEFAWHFGNAANEQYKMVGTKKANPWGLFDMHGNVSEWVLDQYAADFYGTRAGALDKNPLHTPQTIYPRVVRGGSYIDDANALRSAARDKSSPKWKQSDPQIPKSVWWHCDAPYFGFRIVRPLVRPSTGRARKEVGQARASGPENARHAAFATGGETRRNRWRKVVAAS